MTDPMNILKLQNLLKQRFPRTKLIAPLKRSENLTAAVDDLGSLDLPLDIRHLILDIIRPPDIQNLLVATEWQIPDSYWRGRFARDIVFEVEDLLHKRK